MSRSIIANEASKLLAFEKWPDEEEDEYEVFLAYCHNMDGLTPDEFLKQIEQTELVPYAILRGWMQRKDAYIRWADVQRRQKTLGLLEKYLEQVKKRLPYIIQREEEMRLAEQKHLELSKLEGNEAKPTLLRAYSTAIRETNEQIGILVRIVKALEPDTGINIQNIVSAIGALPVDKAEEIKRAWGDPAETTVDIP